MTTTRSRKLASFLLVADAIKEEAGKRIRRLRKQRGWTQRELGELVGVGAQTISRWERGMHLGKTETLGLVAAAFDMDVAQFMAGIQEHPETPAIPRWINQELGEIKRQLKEIQKAIGGQNEPNTHGDSDRVRDKQPNKSADPGKPTR